MRYAQRGMIYIAVVLCGNLLGLQLIMAQPNVGDFSPRGLQLDGTTRVVFQGSGLDATTRLLAPFPISSQNVVGEATNQRLELEIQLDDQVPPGIHQVWLVNQNGSSGSFLMSIDSLPQRLVTDTVAGLPVALHGTIRGNQVQAIPFPVIEGQRLVVDIQAKRLGGALQPVLRLFDAEGRQIAAGNPAAPLLGDVRLECVAPKTGTMVVEVQDLLLRGAMPGHYKVSIGDLGFAVAAWPPGVSLDNAAANRATLLGPKSGIMAVLPERNDTEGWYGLRVEQPAGFIGPQPRQYVSRSPELNEQHFAHGEKPSVDVATAINGVLSEPGEHDRFTLSVAKGKKLQISVWADRLGAAVDPVVIARVPGAQELGRGDDAAGSRDAQFLVTVPGDQEAIEVEIWDLLGRGGSDCLYRIEIADADAPALTLTLQQENVAVSGDGGAILVVPINRQRFQGDIQLGLADELPGIEVSGGLIPADSNRGLLHLRLTGEAPPAVTRLLGQSHVASLGHVAARRSPGPLSSQLPWHDRTLAVVPISDIGLSVQSGSLTDDTVLWQGGVHRFPVTLGRAEGKAGPIRVRLLTTQQMPRKKVKKDNKDVEVDATERALRLDESVTLDGGAEAGEVPVAVPSDLKPGPWGVALVAELLTDDKQRVLATATTDVVFPQVKQALSVAVAGEKKIELTMGEAGNGVFSGEITRHNGFAGPVIVTVVGLPQMMEIPEVEVPANETAFELPVSLGADAKPEQLQSLRIVAQAWDESDYLVAESPSEKVNIVLVEKKEQ